MIALLAPLFQGGLAAYGEALACAPRWPDNAIPIAELIADEARLLAALRRHATHLGVTGANLRADPRADVAAAPRADPDAAPHADLGAAPNADPDADLRADPDAASRADLGADLRADRAAASRHNLGVDLGLDLRAAASAWSLDYLAALLPPSVAAASLLRHRFPLRVADVAVSLDGLGAPQRFHILHTGQAMRDSDTAARYGPLLDEHLAPLFQAIGRQTRLPQRILWANAARQLEAVFSQALALSGNDARVKADRDALLRRPSHADGNHNPLHGRQRRATSHGTIPHSECCLRHLLPNQSWCGACPLAPHRATS